jgi:hypothetical protein
LRIGRQNEEKRLRFSPESVRIARLTHLAGL